MLTRMGVRQLGIVSEIDTGVPLMRARHLDREFPVVTKAGGFGRPDTLYRAWRQLPATWCCVGSAHIHWRRVMTYRPVIGITMGMPPAWARRSS
jgi:4-hydroxythreonine-4-phosphate dehydrogenase